MISIRAGILAITLCLVIFAINQMYGWAQGYGPCSLLDRYENI